MAAQAGYGRAAVGSDRLAALLLLLFGPTLKISRQSLTNHICLFTVVFGAKFCQLARQRLAQVESKPSH